jgi:hypothetical protein
MDIKTPLRMKAPWNLPHEAFLRLGTLRLIHSSKKATSVFKTDKDDYTLILFNNPCHLFRKDRQTIGKRDDL